MAPITASFKGIVLVGTKHSGKSTAAKFAVEQGFTRLGLADPIKDGAVAMLNTWLKDAHLHHGLDFTRNELDAYKDEYFVPLLQWLGTDWVRRYLNMPTYWIDTFLRTVAATPGFVVCDDCRFPNEADALREAGFVIVRVIRDETERLASLAAANAGSIAGHASETELDAIQPDLVLRNRSLELLKLGMEHICEMVKHPPEVSTYALSSDGKQEDDAA